MPSKVVVQYVDLKAEVSVVDLQVAAASIESSTITIDQINPTITVGVSAPYAAISYRALKSVATWLQATVTDVFLDADPKFASLFDGVTVGEVLALHLDTEQSEQVALQDLVGLSLSKSVVDTATITEVIDILLTTIREIEDSFSVSDSLANAVTKPLPSETTSVSDDAVLQPQKGLDETIGFEDSTLRAIGVAPTDTPVVSDSAPLFQSELLKSESVSFTDAPSLLVSPVFVNTTLVSETLTKLSNSALADSLSVTEVFSRVSVFNVPLSDAFTIDDLANVDALDVDTTSAKGNIFSVTDSLVPTLVSTNSGVLNANTLNQGTLNA